MFSLPFFPDPAALYLRPLNALLRREAWARERLARHTGKSLRFLAGPVKVSLSIQSEGLLGPCDPAIVPDVTLTLPADKLPGLPQALRSRDPADLADVLHVEGDAGLARVVSDMARDLRWDPEEDLARLVGDVAAARLADGGRRAARGMRQAASSVAGNVAEYIADESGMMLSRPAFEEWSARVSRLGARLDSLEARARAIEASGGRQPMRRG